VGELQLGEAPWVDAGFSGRGESVASAFEVEQVPVKAAAGAHTGS